MRELLQASLGLGLLIVLSCTGSDPGPVDSDLPDDTDDTQVDTDTGDGFPVDTSEVSFDEVPDNYITIEQIGSWSLSPLGGPYASLSGTLTLLETGDFDLDDTDPDNINTDTGDGPTILCEVTYAMTGFEYTEPNGCPSCDFVMNVEFTVTAGDPSRCNDPDAPLNGEIRRLGYSSSSGQIWFNYYGSGVYVPWYTAIKIADLVNFTWATTVAYTVEDD